jgi:hypothetical protein
MTGESKRSGAAARDRHESTIARIVRNLRRDRVAGITAVGAVAVLAAAAVGFGGGAHSVLPRIGDIGAWLSNDSQGSVTHANGLSGKADTRIGLTNAAGHPLTVTQDGDTVIVLDTVTGKVTRIDPSQLTVTQSVTYGSPNVQIISGGGKAYVVDPTKGLVQAIDPDRLSVIGEPVALRAPLGVAAVDGRGTAWVPELSTGQLVPVTGGTKGAPVPVGSPGDVVHLTMANGVPVATDTTAATMTVLPPSGARQTVKLPATGGTAMVGPTATDGSVVPLLATGSHQMVIVDTRDAVTTEVALDGFAADDLGAPQALGGRVYVPDSTTGRLIVYDSVSGRMLNQITVSGRRGRISVFMHDGMLWANDASGSAAVSVDSSGAVHPISKYTPDLPGGPLPRPSSSPSPHAQGGGPDPGAGAPGSEPKGGSGERGKGDGGNGGGNGNGGGAGVPGRPTPPKASPAPPNPKPPNPTPPSPTPPSPTPPGPTPPRTTPPRTTPPAAPPNAPTGIGETAGAGYIEVKFSPSTGATPTSYTLSGLPSGATADPQSVPPDGPYQFRVSGGMDCGTPYKFSVVANFPTGTRSNSGGSALSCTAPGAPSGLSLDVGTQKQITATWQAARANGGTVTYTAGISGGTSANVTGTSKTFTGLKNFQSYTVTVTATNGAGASKPPASAAKSLSHAVWNGHIGNNPKDPVALRPTPSTSQTQKQWFPAPGGAAVSVVCVMPGGAWVDPTGSPSGSNWYKVSNPQPGYVATGYVVGVSGVWSC